MQVCLIMKICIFRILTNPSGYLLHLVTCQWTDDNLFASRDLRMAFPGPNQLESHNLVSWSQQAQCFQKNKTWGKTHWCSLLSSANTSVGTAIKVDLPRTILVSVRFAMSLSIYLFLFRFCSLVPPCLGLLAAFPPLFLLYFLSVLQVSWRDVLRWKAGRRDGV